VYRIDWTKQAEKDSAEIERAGLKKQVAKIQGIVEINPFERTIGHRFEKLKGYNPPIYTRKINDQHRYVYTIEDNTENAKNKNGEIYKGIVVVHRMWKHFP
jgi:Txe/YoeB family toxin of toxin-antitoxin system